MDNENIFDQLFKLLNQPGSVNWALAEQVAGHMVGAAQPIDPWLADEYLELTRLAQLKIGEHSGLVAGPLFDTLPLDRATWTSRNLRSFGYLVEPLAEKLAAGAMGPADAILKPLGPALMGMQMGALVGGLAQRALGQFDVGLPVAEHGDITFVVPNVEAFATDHGLDPRQVRLWAALHEVMHHVAVAQAWVRPHLDEIIRQHAETIDIDFSALTEKLAEFQDPARMQEMLQDGSGLEQLLAGDDDGRGAEMEAFMAVIDGYRTFVVRRAGRDLLPDLDRIETAARRRESATPEGPAGAMIGLPVRRTDPGLGAGFCEEVATRWGEEALRKIWDGPENLPTLDELSDPVGWAARVLLPEVG